MEQGATEMGSYFVLTFLAEQAWEDHVTALSPRFLAYKMQMI